MKYVRGDMWFGGAVTLSQSYVGIVLLCENYVEAFPAHPPPNTCLICLSFTWPCEALAYALPVSSKKIS